MSLSAVATGLFIGIGFVILLTWLIEAADDTDEIELPVGTLTFDKDEQATEEDAGLEFESDPLKIPRPPWEPPRRITKGTVHGTGQTPKTPPPDSVSTPWGPIPPPGPEDRA